jgi:hypothetical protein
VEGITYAQLGTDVENPTFLDLKQIDVAQDRACVHTVMAAS